MAHLDGVAASVRAFAERDGRGLRVAGWRGGLTSRPEALCHGDARRRDPEVVTSVRIGADGSPHWLGVWPTAQDNPRHAGLESWMAVHGHRIVGKPATWSDSCEHEEG